MENQTVVQSEKVQSETTTTDTVTVFRWSRWVDGNGCLFVVVGFYNYGGVPLKAKGVELLNVDLESTLEVEMPAMLMWVNEGTLKRVETPIMI